MNIVWTVAILAIAELICFGWSHLIKPLEIAGLYTHLLPFMLLDSLTIKLIDRFPVFKLTRWLKICLCISIIAHMFGAFFWVLSSPWMAVYEQSKDVIFYLELLAFIGYGIYNGGRKLRSMAFPSSMDGLFKLQGIHRAVQASQERAGK